jgi:hypothetical protein
MVLSIAFSQPVALATERTDPGGTLHIDNMHGGQHSPAFTALGQGGDRFFLEMEVEVEVEGVGHCVAGGAGCRGGQCVPDQPEAVPLFLGQEIIHQQ